VEKGEGGGWCCFVMYLMNSMTSTRAGKSSLDVTQRSVRRRSQMSQPYHLTGEPIFKVSLHACPMQFVLQCGYDNEKQNDGIN
jgi:hypothetical protein